MGYVNRIDLIQVVFKYTGETEKNSGRVFWVLGGLPPGGRERIHALRADTRLDASSRISRGRA